MRAGDDKRPSAVAAERQGPLRFALTAGEAAQALGCSRDFFDEHTGPELRWIRPGGAPFVDGVSFDVIWRVVDLAGNAILQGDCFTVTVK